MEIDWSLDSHDPQKQGWSAKTLPFAVPAWIPSCSHPCPAPAFCPPAFPHVQVPVVAPRLNPGLNAGPASGCLSPGLAPCWLAHADTSCGITSMASWKFQVRKRESQRLCCLLYPNEKSFDAYAMPSHEVVRFVQACMTLWEPHTMLHEIHEAFYKHVRIFVWNLLEYSVILHRALMMSQEHCVIFIWIYDVSSSIKIFIKEFAWDGFLRRRFPMDQPFSHYFCLPQCCLHKYLTWGTKAQEYCPSSVFWILRNPSDFPEKCLD